MDQQSAGAQGVLTKGLGILRLLSDAGPQGLRVTDIARQLELSQATVHRLLQTLIAEGFVVQRQGSKSYALTLALFSLVARAHQQESSLRAICRSSILRIVGVLQDSAFVLLRDRYDVVCIDKMEGSYITQSLTGGIGGRIPIGLGQGSIAILAALPESEQNAILAFNIPRFYQEDGIDEPQLRARIKQTQQNGYVLNTGPGKLTGIGGIAVAFTDTTGYPVGAIGLSVLTERLTSERLPFIVDILKHEAAAISSNLNPFDPALGSPHMALSN